MKLMIVEDNASMRHLIKSMVGELVDEISECSDGDEALALYSQILPDWVFMDIRMQRMDGLTACRQIKAAYPQANICIVTDYSDPQIKAAAIEAGARRFVSKDNLHELRSVISLA
jgi:CheY-like chemotaxis protein